MDTIFALSSGALPAGVAIIRVSGAEVGQVLKTFCGHIPKPRYLEFAAIKTKAGEVLDRSLIAYFPAPNSFTGEDCAEFHLHGSKALVARFLEELAAMPHCRHAEAGEFTRRAFSNGKMDLTEAEGLADLLSAETESQRKLAMQGASGDLKRLYNQWRKKLIKARAMIEAELDFSDEEDAQDAVSEQNDRDLASLQQELLDHIGQAKTAEIMRDGLKIVLAGAPNAGKSSFINRLSGRDVALVTDQAGTTRDALEIRLVLEGVPVLITDTAGLRPTKEQIEQLGVKAAYQRIQEADLVLYLADMHQPAMETTPLAAELDTNAEIWPIGNKSDLGEADFTKWPIQLSAKTGQGWDVFIAKLKKFCFERAGLASAMLPARSRQLQLLKTAAAELEHALTEQNLPMELQAEYLRRASNALGRITGEIDVEDLLDVIFSEFCIGK